MPTPKTECTELAVAFGLLGLNFRQAVYFEVGHRFDGTLPREKFFDFLRTIRTDARIEALADSLWELGLRVGSEHPDLFPPGSRALWYGPLQQSRSVAASQDIMVATTAVSVKVNSHVVYNSSPYNVFESVPRGLVAAGNTPNWFVETAADEYEALFAPCADASGFATVRDFEARASKADRRRVQAVIKGFDEREQADFDALYLTMCHAAAVNSAERFNAHVAATLGTVHAAGLKDALLRYFLRVDGMPYVLMGLDGGKPFAVLLPDISEWKRRYEFVSLSAGADCAAGQSRVDFRLTLREKSRNGNVVTLPFHAEIRWSHGKFCGNPEAKVYRDFGWSEVPGFKAV